MTEQELREQIIKIIHPNYHLPKPIDYDCCIKARQDADSIISLMLKAVEGARLTPGEQEGIYQTWFNSENKTFEMLQEAVADAQLEAVKKILGGKA